MVCWARATGCLLASVRLCLSKTTFQSAYHNGYTVSGEIQISPTFAGRTDLPGVVCEAENCTRQLSISCQPGQMLVRTSIWMHHKLLSAVLYPIG
ncbi:predicted protein [Pyrenophora tritici-repentis Pt-1C-BFP]|uniref:Secreted protein n=1 Tax=Pyrenophora tritici-repentis (strain Pt-1C-BFP) TaxID=426418 RepID=B2W3S7_PYRTR|nr:uncharacterized protein PTRG_05127 [Pyrenophora tritici-repentis Pt-1C-BFP]EDU48034.1 predicted protein [Pyrenophora tritici-repentis Pt-1C-BFP]